MPVNKLTPLRLAVAAAAVVAIASPMAASAAPKISTTEQMLAAAGFQAMPANTPERQAEMASLPAGRLIAQPRGAGFTYVLADPKGCACVYMGDAADYQAYQQLALNQKIAQQNADAADAYRFGSMNWGLWGPYDGWGWQGPLFVHIGHRGGSGGHGGGFGGHGGGYGGHGGGSGHH